MRAITLWHGETPFERRWSLSLRNYVPIKTVKGDDRTSDKKLTRSVLGNIGALEKYDATVPRTGRDMRTVSLNSSYQDALLAGDDKLLSQAIQMAPRLQWSYRGRADAHGGGRSTMMVAMTLSTLCALMDIESVSISLHGKK